MTRWLDDPILPDARTACYRTPMLPGLGRTLIIIGLLIVALGVLATFADKLPWLGRLPGDISIKRDNFSFYFPITTCIVMSVVLTLLFYLFRR